MDNVETLQVTANELGHAVLIRTFRLVGATLGQYVIRVLQRVYGDDHWQEKAGELFTKSTFSRLENTRRQGLSDIYLATELILHNLEVFQKEMRSKADSGSIETFGLLRLAMDVDCVNKTRTWLFHGVDVSPEEAVKCILCLENIWWCFAQLEKGGTLEKLSAQREVRSLSVVYFFTSRSGFSTVIQCIQNFFPKLCLILKKRFLVRLSSNFQERLLKPSSSPEFLLW